jgi:hypothetical protein
MQRSWVSVLSRRGRYGVGMERWIEFPGEGKERKVVVRFRLRVWMDLNGGMRVGKEREGKGRGTENSARGLRWFIALIWDLSSGRRGRKRKRPRKWR